MRRVLYSTRKSQTLQSTFKLITEAKERTEKGLRLAEIEKERGHKMEKARGRGEEREGGEEE